MLPEYFISCTGRRSGEWISKYPEIVKVRIAVYEYCKWPENRMSNGENPFLSEYCRNKESFNCRLCNKPRSREVSEQKLA
jgi:hypothetical protein